MKKYFSDETEKIVESYLNRLRSRLEGLPGEDQDELLGEIYSHIYESFKNDPTENERDRILSVLDRFGEPHDVFSEKISAALMNMGIRKKLPFYVLSGIAIKIFGIPVKILGIGVAAFFLPLAVLLIPFYYLTAGCLILAGGIGSLSSLLRIIDANFLGEQIRIFTMISDHRIAGLLGLWTSIICVALGSLMLMSSKYISRGIKFLFHICSGEIKGHNGREKTQGEGCLCQKI